MKTVAKILLPFVIIGAIGVALTCQAPQMERAGQR